MSTDTMSNGIHLHSTGTLEIFAKMLLWRFVEKILTFLGAKRLYKLVSLCVCLSVCVCVPTLRIILPQN